MVLIFTNWQKTLKINKLEAGRIIYGMLKAVGYEEWDLGVWYVNTRTIRKFNNRYRAINKPTDILSFPTYSLSEIPEPGRLPEVKEGEDRALGDILICPPYIKKDCLSRGIIPEYHLPMLYAHGISHLLGFDHETDEDYEKMQKYESYILSNYKQYMDDFHPEEHGLQQQFSWNDQDPYDQSKDRKY